MQEFVSEAHLDDRGHGDVEGRIVHADARAPSS
jgi:hypothetical protein